MDAPAAPAPASNATYTVLARRFRPQAFQEVVGQQHVAQALRNAIRKDRVAHAYLFTGARGVGKTSMARILAKALNCPNAVDGDPCNECEICQGISSGNDFDVLEIDGASNRGIDDIRSLRANVNVKSMRTRYKMYIIDEVHMLTKEAFNALLKTLEEPPPNVKFVFCTTEPNKVPDTILSRCQRFDFATIETANIIGRLQQIAEAEGMQVEPAAVELVARRANGSMRDSQSLFDQLLAFGGDMISAEDVHRLLGTAPDDRLMDLVDAVLSHRHAEALDQFDKALSSGVQASELVDQLISYFRDLMVLAAGAENVSLLSVSSEHRQRLAEQAKQAGLQSVVAAMQILAETRGRMARVTFGRSLAELGLLRVALLEDLQPLSELIGELKKGGAVTLGGAAPATPSRPAANSPSRPPVQASSAPVAEKKKLTDENDGGQPSYDQATAAPPLPFGPGREMELWTQILSRITDALKTHAAVVSRVAISGPNQLELWVPASYSFSKTYCDRPEVQARLRRLAEELTGQAIQFHFRLLDDSTEKPADKPQPEAATSGRFVRVDPDDYVEKALSVFGATVASVMKLSANSGEQES